MKVQIRQSFVAPPYATFQIGEELDIPEELATAWIAAGRAVPAGSVPEYVNNAPHYAAPHVPSIIAATIAKVLTPIKSGKIKKIA